MIYYTCTTVLTDVTVYERFRQRHEAVAAEPERPLLN